MINNKAKILLIDDDEVFCQVLSEELKDIGFSVDYCLNASPAWVKVKGCKYDLIITGLIMPNINGDYFIEYFRQENPTIPVIVLSCCDDDKIKANCFKAGVSAYLSKPYDTEELLLIIDYALS